MSLTISRPWLYAVAIPFCLIVLQVFVDISFGVLGEVGRAGGLSVGVMIRGAIALVAIWLILRMKASPLKPYLFVFLTVFLLSNLIWMLNSDAYGVMHEINQGMKVVFPWLVAGILLYLDRQIPIDRFYVYKLIAWAGFLSAAALLISDQIGMGRETYGDWSYGSKGMFNAQNDIGLTLLLSLVAAIAVLARTRRIIHFVIVATIAVACLILGTRTGVLGPALVVVVLVGAAVFNFRLFAPFEGRGGIASTALLVLPVVIAATVAGVIFTQSSKTDYLTKRIEKLAEETPRKKLEVAGMQRIGSRDFVFTVFGDGGLAFKKHVAENLGKGRRMIDPDAMAAPGQSKKLAFAVHRVENDIIDVVGFYGVIQFAVIYAALAIVFLMALRRAIRDWSLENVAALLIFVLFLGHSTLAGHGIFSAQVATVLAPILFLQLRDLRWRAAPDPARAAAADIAEVPRG